MIFNHCGFSRKISYREKVGKSRWRRLTNCGNIFQVASVTTVEYANEILRKLFLGQYHKSLLILDDVWSSQIIKSFDVCAKVLVTTQDITVLDVISKNNVNVVKMQPFTQEESLKVQQSTYRVSQQVWDMLNVTFWSSEKFASEVSYIYKILLTQW